MRKWENNIKMNLKNWSVEMWIGFIRFGVGISGCLW